MAAPKNNWLFSLLWINLAVAMVVLIERVANPAASWRDLLHALVYALIFANTTGLLGTLVIGWVACRLPIRNVPLMAILAAGIAVFIPIGCLIAQVMLLAVGFVQSNLFWQSYFSTLRVAMPLGLVFGFGALMHGALRGRVQIMEEKLHEKEIAEERARKLAAEARLEALEARIHPHFLFNTLNSISSLIAVNPARAEQTVGQLASLLRSSLDSGQQPLIPLRQELAMVRSYLDIEKVRFGEKLKGNVDVAAELEDAKVPPMSVQSLVENAVKHGITSQNGGGEVWVDAGVESGSLRIEVSDSGPGFDLTAIRPGHGLDNLVQRLDALFGARGRLNVVRRDGYSVVEMILPRV
ncbi:MAG TPA: histidine kinase [Bryobacteraceae bacterium]|nr:histidine kinase [Bryobacteraceae bacterium]